MEQLEGLLEHGVIGRERLRARRWFLLGTSCCGGRVVAIVTIVVERGRGVDNFRGCDAFFQNGLAIGIVIVGDGEDQSGAVVQGD